MPDLEKLGEGREAEVFVWGEGRILRLMRSPNAIQDNDAQAQSMRAVLESGAAAPVIYETVTVEGRPGVVMERLTGPSLLGELANKPWNVRKAGTLMGKLHSEIHEIAAPRDLTDTVTRLRSSLRSELVPPDLARAALSLLEELPEGHRLGHGDFHPGNVMITRGDRAVVIDWTNAVRGDPHADVARTVVLCKWGSIPGDVPLTLRILDRIGRSYLLRRYLHVYRSHSTLDVSLLSRWKLVCAVARLAEGIEGEAERIIKWVRSRI